jgi:N-acetylmuramoyl-L-alanine amidase
VALRHKTLYMGVHCSATPPSMDIGVKEIDQWHRAKGWKSCGYHNIIRRSGLVEFGRHPLEIGAHVAGYNSISVGVCLIGGLDELGSPVNNFGPEQMDSLKSLIIMYRKAYPHIEIKGHRDFSPDGNNNGIIEESEWLKQCPCFDVSLFMKGIFF